MGLAAALAFVAGGLILLAAGGEALVRGATRLARLAGVTPAVIGLTVVAMGTSLPEMVVSVLSALRGTPDIAVGNVVGSNIINVTLILGLTALIVPLPVHGTAVRLEWPAVFAASVVVLLLALDGAIGRGEGLGLTLALAGFTAYMVQRARREIRGSEAAEFAEETEQRSAPPPAPGRRAVAALAFTVAGILLLVAGGRLLVDGSVALARLAGLSERVIGLTIVAAGTSAPEIATSVAAALRRHTDVAVANILGSNLFNLLAILGVTASIVTTPVAPAFVRYDMIWMLATTLLVLPIIWSRQRVGRGEGAVLVSAYVVYVALLFGTG